MILSSRNFTLYFGNRDNQIFPGKYDVSHKVLTAIGTQLSVTGLTVLHQVHGTDAHGASEGIEIFKRKGDILLTQNVGHALGVVTADCLPVFLYDGANHACALVHAGWRGSVAGIVPKAVGLMEETFGTKPQDLVVHFGPSGKRCCYEVQKDFCDHIEKRHHSDVFLQKTDKIYFDNVTLNWLQLHGVGVLEKNINLDYNVCTICDQSYHSYRRDGKAYGLQATMVVLR